MDGVSQAAGVTASQAMQQVQSAIGLKVMEQINQQQQSVANLVESSVEATKQVQATEPGKGAALDVTV